MDARVTVGRLRVEVSEETVTLATSRERTALRPDEARAVAAALVTAAGAAERPRALRRPAHVDDELQRLAD